MKKLWMLLLAVVMLVALTACNQPDPDTEKDPTTREEFTTAPTTTAPVKRETLVGAWECKLIVDAEKMELEGVDASVECHIEAEFNEDLTYRVTIDQDALGESVEQFVADIKDDLLEITYQQFKEQNMTKEQVDAMLQEKYGMTLQEMCQLMLEQIDVKEMISEYRDLLPTAGTYRVEGDVLYLTQPDDEGGFEEVAFFYQLVDGKLRLSSENEDVRKFFDFIGGSHLEFIPK